MDKTKKLIKQALLFAIDSIKEDIARDSDAVDNRIRAEAILALAQAYREVDGCG